MSAERERLIEIAAGPEREGCPQWSADICKRAFRGEDCPCWDRAAAVIDALGIEQVGWGEETHIEGAWSLGDLLVGPVVNASVPVFRLRGLETE